MSTPFIRCLFLLKNRNSGVNIMPNSQIAIQIEDQDTPVEMSIQIAEPGTPGLDTYDATATAGDIAFGKTAYVQGVKITGTYEVPSDATEVTF